MKVIGAPADRIATPACSTRWITSRAILAEGFDSLDAFLTHMWAVTVIGAPKKAAAQTIERSGEGRARLVRRRGRHDLAERRYQHRHPDPHHVPARRHGALSGGRDAALRFRARDGRARDAAEGHRLLPRAGHGGSRQARAGGARSLPARARSCCWSTTTIASSTRWPTTRARPARRWSPIAPASRRS